ncbi:MAG: DedA family protein [Sulfurospirillum sp.]|nr:MAG: DedA family protein [Sulfurospirillum sp.]
MLSEIVTFIVNTVSDWGYFGIFAMMFLESSFFPFPSEVAMIPAGYLAAEGKMNLFAAIFIGTAGSLTGALFNYYLAVHFGRNFLVKYGKYFFITEESIDKVEKFFKVHGHISTFSGRLIPAVRQYISFPAGLARMNLKEFAFYTTLGAGIWTTILALIGYFVGKNEALIHQYTKEITIAIILLLSVGIGYYIYRHKKRS